MQGAGIQQGAAGQAATLGSQQQIAAQQNLANLSQNQINQTGQGATNLSNAAQGEQGILQNANNSFNNTITGMQSNINNVNASTSAGNASAIGKLGGGALNIASSLFAEGGEVDLGSSKSSVSEDAPTTSAPSDSGPSPAPTEKSGGMLGGLTSMLAKGGPVHPEHFHNHVKSYFSQGGAVKALVSPNEVYLSPENVHKVIHEGANPLKIGHRIPGKAKVKGDSYKNDTVPVTLESGGVVIDRKNSMDPHKAALFVHQSINKRRG